MADRSQDEYVEAEEEIHNDMSRYGVGPDGKVMMGPCQWVGFGIMLIILVFLIGFQIWEFAIWNHKYKNEFG
jgi:hypothetical protein